MGASLSRPWHGDKAASRPAPAPCTDPRQGTEPLGETGRGGEDPREAKQGASSQSPFPAAAHPIFHKSGYAKLPAGKICLRNKGGDCRIQLSPVLPGTKGFPTPAPRAQIKAGEVFTLPQGLFEAGAGCAGAALFARFGRRHGQLPAALPLPRHSSERDAIGENAARHRDERQRRPTPAFCCALPSAAGAAEAASPPLAAFPASTKPRPARHVPWEITTSPPARAAGAASLKKCNLAPISAYTEPPCERGRCQGLQPPRHPPLLSPHTLATGQAPGRQLLALERQSQGRVAKSSAGR